MPATTPSEADHHFVAAARLPSEPVALVAQPITFVTKSVENLFAATMATPESDGDLAEPATVPSEAVEDFAQPAMLPSHSVKIAVEAARGFAEVKAGQKTSGGPLFFRSRTQTWRADSHFNIHPIKNIFHV